MPDDLPEKPSHPLEKAPDTESPEPEEAPRRRHPLEISPEERESDKPREPRVFFRLPLQIKAIITPALVAINVVIFVAGLLLPDLGDRLFILGANYPPAIFLEGEMYRLFTSMFLHATPIHIFFNCYVLYIMGSMMERVLGRQRFIILYFLGGLAGSILSAVLGNFSLPSIGASGAVFAIWGAEGMHMVQHRQIYGKFAQQRLRSLVIWGSLNLLIGLASPNIDNWGHIGGMIGGLVLTWLIGPRFAPDAPQSTPEGDRFTQLHELERFDQRIWTLGIYCSALILLMILGTRFAI